MIWSAVAVFDTCVAILAAVNHYSQLSLILFPCALASVWCVCAQFNGERRRKGSYLRTAASFRGLPGDSTGKRAA